MPTGRLRKNQKNYTITDEVDFEYSSDSPNVYLNSSNSTKFVDLGGAAIAITQGTLSSEKSNTIKYCYNECRVGKDSVGGGAILAYYSDITINKGDFRNNYSNTNGGAIAIVDSGEDQSNTISNSEFVGNVAENDGKDNIIGGGGAIYFSGYGSLTINGCLFLTASDSIYLDGTGMTLNFQGNITLAASIATGTTYGSKNTKTQLLDNAKITFTNTEAIDIVKLKFSANNKFTFNTYNGSNTISFDSQDLSNVTFAYNHSGSYAQDVLAIGVTGIKDEYKVITDENYVNNDDKLLSFFHLDTTNKVLTHNLTDTLTVVIGRDATGAGEFASEDALFAWAGDNFKGTLNQEIAENYTYDHNLIGTDDNKFNGAALTVKGTVEGSAIAVQANGEDLDDIESTTINVTGTVEKYVIGGAYAKNGNVDIDFADVVLAGTLNNHVFGGSWVSGTTEATASSECGTTAVEIKAGATQEGGYVLGGGMASGNGATSKVDSANIYVNADFDSTIFGGGWAQKEGKAEVENATINIFDGTTSTVFAGGTNQAGASSTVTDQVDIYLDGGTAEYIYLNGKYSGSVVEGDVTLYVSQDATVSLIDGLTSTGTVKSAQNNTTIDVSATLTVNKISFVDNWNIQAGGAIVFAEDFDFEPETQNKYFDKINLSIDDDTVDAEGRDVLTTADGIFNFNDSFVNVTLNGEDAAYENGVFASANYMLSLIDDKKLVFAAAQLA